MKKIIITTSILALTSCYAGYSNDSSNYKSDATHVTKTTKSSTVNNTLIAHKYDRNNSVSTNAIQKIGKSNLGYTSVLATAKAEQNKAKEVGFEWTTIRPLLKEAKKDQKAGKEANAIKKLQQAIKHAKLGQQQAVDQANAGPRF